MPERVEANNINPQAADSDAAALQALQGQIEQHRREEKEKSYLGSAISFLADPLSGSNRSLSELESLKAEIEEKRRQGDATGARALLQKATDGIASDRKSLSLEGEIEHYGAGFFKTASLFVRGRTGLLGAVAFHALDQMRPQDSVKEQLADLAMGGLKGGLIKGTFEVLGAKEVGIAAKGAGLGLSSRLLESGLNRRNYIDKTTGQVDIAGGLKNMTRTALSREAILTDMIVFGTSHALVGTADSLTLGAVKRSPVLATMLTGTTFGFSSGATGEIMRQKNAGEAFDLSSVVKRGLLQGALDTVATGPAIVQQRSALRARGERDASLLAVERMKQAGSEGLLAKSPEASRLVSQAGEASLSFERAERTLPLAPERLPRPGETLEEFAAHIKSAPQPVRLYDVEGVKIVVPEKYATALDTVTGLRAAVELPANLSHAEARQALDAADRQLQANPLAERATPQDLAQAIRQLPARGFVKEIVLFDHENPTDTWRKQNSPDHVTAATTSSDGKVEFYKAERDPAMLGDSLAYSSLLRVLSHEWSHVAKYRAQAESGLFDLASEVEKNGFHARPDSRTNAGENWAILLGEEILSPSRERFEAAVSVAPVRSLILGRALSKILAEVPEAQRGEQHGELLNRLGSIEKIARPLADSYLLSRATHGEGTVKTTAQGLLLELGSDSAVSRLGEVETVNLSYRNISKYVLPRVASLTGVRRVDLSGTNVGDRDLPVVGTIPSLESARLHGTAISDQGLANFLKVRQLTLAGLDPAETSTGARGTEPAIRVRAIEDLDVEGTKITDASVPLIAQLAGLKTLNIRFSQISPRGARLLQRSLPGTSIYYTWMTGTQ